MTVPKLNRLSRFDAFPQVDPSSWVRFMAIDQEKALQIEGAFEELTTQLIAIAAAQATADSKNRTFRQTSAPTAEATGDLWIDTDDGNKAYRWDGGAWVAIQDVGAAYALLAINPDGTIADDAVVTASVLAGAVLATPGGNVTSSTTISSGSYTWTDCGSWTVLMTGVEATIRIDFDSEVIDNCKLMYRIQCDGVTLGRERGPITVNTADEPGYSITRKHTPSSGSRTYVLQCAVNDAGDIIIHDPVADITENRNV